MSKWEGFKRHFTKQRMLVMFLLLLPGGIPLVLSAKIVEKIREKRLKK